MSANGRQPALELAGVVAGYDAGAVLHDVHLTVGTGSIVALLGPNGAGKSTLLRVAAGLLRPDAGEVRIGGETVTRRRPSERAARGLCLVPEGRGVFPSLSVEENLRLQVRASSPDRDLSAAFDAFPVLAARRSQAAGSLSGGEQQMLALSRCFLGDPKVVLLDEVSMGLAPRVLDEIFTVLESLPRRGLSVLLVEQYASRALELAAHAYVLARGEIAYSGAPAGLGADQLMAHYVAGTGDHRARPRRAVAAPRPEQDGAPPAVPYEVPTKRAALGQITRMALRDAGLRRGRALSLPRSAQEITPQWLTSVLCAGVPGAHVTAVRAVGGSSGTTTRTAIAVDYDGAGRAAALPERVFVKSTASRMQRILFGLGGSIEGEAGFYNHVRPRLAIEAPAAYHAEVSLEAWRYVALIEDVVATRGAEFWVPGTVIDRRQAEDLLASMAVWHGAYWDRAELGALRWLKTPADHLRLFDSMIGLRKRAHVGARRARAVIPAALRERGDDLYRGVGRSMEILSRSPHTYLHGDSHAGNTYRTADGRMGFSDWQIGLRGSWAYDYAYLVTSMLDPADRRAWERGLLDYYLEQLAGAGGPRLERDAAWQAYREATFYPYFAWVFTIGRARTQPQFQPAEVSLVIIERTAAAIAELDSLGAVGLG